MSTSPPLPQEPPAPYEPAVTPAVSTGPVADASMLEDKLPPCFRARPGAAVFTAILGAIFFAFSLLPLWHTDVWGHLAYGRLIWDLGALPATEPLMPLARGVEFVNTAWLSQVLGYLMARQFGIPGLQFLTAVCVTATAGLLCRMLYRQTDRIGWTLLGLAAFFWISWKQLFAVGVTVVLRPQLAGLFLFVCALSILVSKPRRWHWVAMPVVFALWANLHGSFVAGLLLVGLFALGRAGDVLRRTDRFSTIFADWKFWRLVLLTELAATAVLLNPYGLRIYADAWLLAKNTNLQSLLEWQPLTLRMAQGQAVAGVGFMLLLLYRMTPRRIGTGEALALLVFGGLTLWTSRMIVWWAPVAAYCLTLHTAAVWRASRARAQRHVARVEHAPSEPRSLWTVVSIILVWITLAPTPFAQELMHGRNLERRPSVSRLTPVGAAEHLAKEPSAGQVFNTLEFGDYLLWTNPGLPVFVASHAHLVPEEIWTAYTDTIVGGVNWETTLNRYGVTTIVLDRPLRQSFIDRLAEERNWEMTYEDNRSAVFRRVNPVP